MKTEEQANPEIENNQNTPEPAPEPAVKPEAAVQPIEFKCLICTKS